MSDHDKYAVISVHVLKQWRQIASDDHKKLAEFIPDRKNGPCLITLDIDSILKRKKP